MYNLLPSDTEIECNELVERDTHLYGRRTDGSGVRVKESCGNRAVVGMLETLSFLCNRHLTRK